MRGEANASDFVALVIPCGVISTDILRTNAAAIASAITMAEQYKPVAAVCHAPWALIEAGMCRRPGAYVVSEPARRPPDRRCDLEYLDGRRRRPSRYEPPRRRAVRPTADRGHLGEQSAECIERAGAQREDDGPGYRGFALNSIDCCHILD